MNTSRRAPAATKVLKARRNLCQERIAIERKLADDYARIAAIETELKAIATAAGESFKEEFAGKGSVAVGGRVEAEFKGDVPIIITEAWQALKPIEQKRYVKAGLVTIEAQWGRASNGRVTVKVF